LPNHWALLTIPNWTVISRVAPADPFAASAPRADQHKPQAENHAMTVIAFFSLFGHHPRGEPVW